MKYETKFVLCEAKTTYVPQVNPNELPKIGRAADVAALLTAEWEGVWHRETVKAVLLDASNHVLGVMIAGVGGVTMCPVDVKLVLQAALTGNASNVILVHNHPSGNVQPSDCDDSLTRKVKEGCEAVGLTLLDHMVVIGDGKYFSYADNSKL
jgi:DNA repair protein RadC